MADIRDRPVPFPRSSKAFWLEYARLRQTMPDYEAKQLIQAANAAARSQAAPGEQCGAWARSRGRQCQAPARANGRCFVHGGMCEGPTTADGMQQAMINLAKGWNRTKGSKKHDILVETDNKQMVSENQELTPPPPPADSGKV